MLRGEWIPREKFSILIRHIFPKDDIQALNKHIKMCSTLIVIREMKIKTIKF